MTAARPPWQIFGARSREPEQASAAPEVVAGPDEAGQEPDGAPGQPGPPWADAALSEPPKTLPPRAAPFRSTPAQGGAAQGRAALGRRVATPRAVPGRAIRRMSRRRLRARRARPDGRGPGQPVRPHPPRASGAAGRRRFPSDSARTGKMGSGPAMARPATTRGWLPRGRATRGRIRGRLPRGRRPLRGRRPGAGRPRGRGPRRVPTAGRVPRRWSALGAAGRRVARRWSALGRSGPGRAALGRADPGRRVAARAARGRALGPAHRAGPAHPDRGGPAPTGSARACSTTPGVSHRPASGCGCPAGHTVVALAGGTGSGKSALFNGLAGADFSPVGVTRPATRDAHACVWGGPGPGRCWTGWASPRRYRYARSSALERGEEAMTGLILLDLPDHDSVVTGAPARPTGWWGWPT